MAYPINDNPELIALVKETLCPSDINVLLTDKTGVFLLATLTNNLCIWCTFEI